ncbi:HAD family hydrolase [Cohnella lupini]|uniref:Nucleotidase n=1 Tax=Cohnella lupini TaxID=1294267 RepID=A0A3D9HNM5_9BACL|nr:HAD family hydrolase [Cohnella lupini]RED51100.1 hypothetical protein DFP95_1535 [Cohnella lupini]
MNHIGLDFDDTLVDMRSSIVELLNELTGKNLISENIEELGRDSKISVMTSRPLEWMHSAVKWINEKDNPEHAVYIADAGIDVMLLDKPYNQNCHHPRIKRVNSWTEIRKMLLS